MPDQPLGERPGALAPYRVVDLTTHRWWLCGRILADLGADVVKVEPPGGDPGRRWGPAVGDRTADREAGLAWWFANRGKRSVTADPADPDGLATVSSLIAEADLVIESWGPGGAAAAGLDLATLAARHPSLVVTSLSPFGLDGPDAGSRGPDLVVGARSGLVWLTGDPDRPPVRVSVPQSAGLACAEGAVHSLVALHHAARTGQGQHVDVSALAAGVRTLMNAWEFKALEGYELTRRGSRVSYSPHRPRHVYRCADGHVTYMAAFGELGGPGLVQLREWAAQDGVAVAPIFADIDVFDAAVWGPVTAAGRTEELVSAIEAVAEAVFASRTKAQLYGAAVAQRLLLAPVSTAADLHVDAQLAARRYWDEVPVGDHGTVRFPGPWARLGRTPLRRGGVPPRVGEHDDRPWARPGRPPSRLDPAHPEPPRTDGEADPFTGLKVFDMSWVGVGPLSARYLADYGATVVRMDNGVRADVLRVNPPFAGGVPGINRSQFYADFNASKLGVGIDLSNPEGREVARRFVQWADVVVESFTPRTLEACGLQYEELRRLNPSLVMLSTCMQGATGPNRNYRGFGQLMGALTGFYEVTGWPDRDPTMVYGAYTDFIAQRFCATALVAAIDHRRRTGEGQHIDLSQLEASMQLLGPELLDAGVNGRVATRLGNRDLDFVPHGIFACRPDGEGPAGERWVAIACEDDDRWVALVAALDAPGWAADGALATADGRRKVEDELDEHLAAWTRDKSPEEVVARLQPAVAAAVVQRPDDLHRDPQLEHLGYFVELDHPVMGRQRYNGMQARLSRTPGRLRKAAPCVGEDTIELLSGVLGCTEDEVAGYLVSGAVELDVS